MASMTIQNHSQPAPLPSAHSAHKITEAPRLNDAQPAASGDTANIQTRSASSKVLHFLGGTTAAAGAGAASGIGGLMLLDAVAGGQFGGEGTRMALLMGGIVGGATGAANGALTGSLINSPAKSALVGAATGAAVGALMGKNLGGRLMALTTATCALSGAVGAYVSNKIQK